MDFWFCLKYPSTSTEWMFLTQIKSKNSIQSFYSNNERLNKSVNLEKKYWPAKHMKFLNLLMLWIYYLSFWNKYHSAMNWLRKKSSEGISNFLDLQLYRTMWVVCFKLFCYSPFFSIMSIFDSMIISPSKGCICWPKVYDLLLCWRGVKWIKPFAREDEYVWGFNSIFFSSHFCKQVFVIWFLAIWGSIPKPSMSYL